MSNARKGPSWLKQHLPWVLTIGFAGAVTLLFVCWVAFSLVPASAEKGFQTQDFARLPVLLNGRLQPFNSVARNSLVVMRGRRSVPLENGETLNATQWLMEVMMRPDQADQRKIFRVDHQELLSLLKLPQDEKYFSFAQIQPEMESLQKEANRINKIEEAQRNAFEKQVMKLYFGVGQYHRLKNSIRPEGAANFAEEIRLFEETIEPGLKALQQQQAGEDFNQQDLQLMVEFFRRYQFLSQTAYPLIIPPWDPEEDPKAWANIGKSLMESMRSGEVHPAVNYYARMATAYSQNQPGDFNEAVSEYRQWLEPQLSGAVQKGHWEFVYNQFAPFYKTMPLYVGAFILGCAFWLNWSHRLRGLGFYFLLIALVVHTIGLIFRMALEGRPPVTNLYSSAIFIGWGAVILGAVLERFFRDGIGTVSASAVGFITLIIAHNLSLGGDTMEMLRAVLDTNFWLATHVVVITLGYASTFVAGVLAIIYILRGFLTRTLTPDTGKALNRMVYGIICFAMLFSFVGTILGGIWADQSWGRFWGWDPKENGALIIVIWNAIILHARWGGMVRERGLMPMAVFGNIVTSFSWFGTNMLGIGLHSYGFMDQAFLWLILFIASQLVIIGIGMLPLRFWASFRHRGPGAAVSSPRKDLDEPKPASVGA